MYEEFYQLTQTPFPRNIATDKLYITPALQEVLDRMTYAASHRMFAVLTEDCGTGKSTILRKLSDTLDPRRHRMLYVSESKLKPRNFWSRSVFRPGGTYPMPKGSSTKSFP